MYCGIKQFILQSKIKYSSKLNLSKNQTIHSGKQKYITKYNYISEHKIFTQQSHLAVIYFGEHNALKQRLHFFFHDKSRSRFKKTDPREELFFEA